MILIIEMKISGKTTLFDLQFYFVALDMPTFLFKFKKSFEAANFL